MATVEGGRSCRETAALYQVSPAFVIRLVARWRTSGSVAASPVRGHPPRVLGPEQGGWLQEWVAATPDITLAELQEKLKGRGIALTMVGIWKYLRRMGLSYKKVLHAAEQDQPDVAAARAAWKTEQPLFDPARLVFHRRDRSQHQHDTPVPSAT